MSVLKKIVLVLLVLVIVYFLGPAPSNPSYNLVMPSVPADATALEDYIKSKEAAHNIKPNNEARIVWYNDSLKQQTDYAIVYLHGFSASQEEGNPVHRNIAQQFGCNLYLSRLAEHGIDTTEQLQNLTADKYWESAKEALVIGKQLGKRVILMGTSTGASNALHLAAAYPNDVAALVLYSPNIAINDPNAWIVNNHWGLQIARLVKGGNYHNPADERPVYRQFWNKPYRLEAVVAVQEYVETAMIDKTFSKITQPTLLLYYYKNEAEQDKVVKVSAMLNMFQQLATPQDKKRAKALPNTGDHVIASPIKSKDVVSVEKETAAFFNEILNIKPIR